MATRKQKPIEETQVYRIETMTPRRQTFADLCVYHEVNDDDMKDLAHGAGVNVAMVWLMRKGQVVSRNEAEAVLRTLSFRVAELYTLKTIRVEVY